MTRSETTSWLQGSLQALRAIFLKGLRHYIRYPGALVFLIALPYLFTIMIGGMGSFIGGANAPQYFQGWTGTSNFFVYQLLGGAVWMIAWVIVEDIGVSLRDEQMKGTLEQNFLTPTSRFLLLLGMGLTDIVITVALFFSMVGVTTLILEPSAGWGLLQALFVLLVGLTPLFGIGFVFAGFVVRFKEPYIFTQVINMLFGVLTGTYYPVTILPYWVQWISGAIPQTYIIQDMRLILLFNQTLVNLYGHLFVLAAMALAYPALGYGVFKLFERRARVSGELSKF